jgi:hypothetical protein
VHVDEIDTWLQLISEQNFNRSPELGSSFINRLLFVWFDKTIWNGRKKTIEQSDLWDLNPEDRFVCGFNLGLIFNLFLIISTSKAIKIKMLYTVKTD